MAELFTLHRGNRPLLLSIPHVGIFIPAQLATGMTPVARGVPDTDWHVERLYGFARALDVSILVATHSRYVVDLNRPPEDTSLYPGQDVTGLVPVDTFDKEPLYLPGQEPDAREVTRRRELFWKPYHGALTAEIDRLRARHDRIVLWDAHSIRSQVPRFFAGRLPDLNIGTAGTADGVSCAPEMATRVIGAVEAGGYSQVINGRFKGGHITRHYGAPAAGVHAIQLELAQCNYMIEAPPWTYDDLRAYKLASQLRAMVEAALAWVEGR